MRIIQKIGCMVTILKTIERNLLKKKFEPEVSIIHAFIKSDSICLDIGASDGRYTLVMSFLAVTGHIYAFEPSAYSFCVLSATSKFHRLKNVTLIKKGLGNKTETADILIPIKSNRKLGDSLAYVDFGRLTKKPEKFLSERIEISTLDDFYEEMGLERVDLIKCDVEGAEYFVFEGGEKTILKHLPVILCEICRSYLQRFNVSIGQVEKFFIEKGYEIYMLKDTRDTLVKIPQIREDGNYFFIHPRTAQSVRNFLN